MKKCWKITPTERPLFGDIARDLSTILGSDEQKFVNESECVDLGYVRVQHPENAGANESVNQQFSEVQPQPAVCNGGEYELEPLLNKPEIEIINFIEE